MTPNQFVPKTAPIIEVFVRFVGLLALFVFTRYIFFWYNHSHFSALTSAIFWQGVRFDAAAIALINSPYFLWRLLPFPIVEKKLSRLIENSYFLFFNAIALLTNLIDTCYFPFSQHRLTTDIFTFIGETNNFATLIPIFLRGYASIAAIWLGCIGLLWGVGRVSSWLPTKLYRKNPAARPWLWTKQIVYRVFVIFLLLTAARGGWQLRPLNVAMAGSVAGTDHAALVLNTPYTLLSTLSAPKLPRYTYFSPEECSDIFDTHIVTSGSVPDVLFQQPRPTHIVLLILEGISSEYSTFLADEPKKLAGFTPFLDSLAQHAIVFRGYANGQQSIESLSSILGGIPSLMAEPFSQTHYAANPIRYGVAQLQQKGFRTLFFHGGKNGTMGFDHFCQIAGIAEYFGMDEYPTVLAARDFDGTWGIADVPYLQYVADKLDDETAPFFATIFTLSSHHPFVVPADYESLLPNGETPMQRVVAYTDDALRQFFVRAQKSKWYNETLFVITADHTNFYGAAEVDYTAHRYAVPMLFYYPPADTAFCAPRLMQQVDILPTICHYCGIETAFASFGKSAFDDSASHFAINYLSGSWRMYIDNYLVEFDGAQITHIWDLANGNEPLSPDQLPAAPSYQKLMQAVLQRYYNGLLDNDW